MEYEIILIIIMVILLVIIHSTNYIIDKFYKEKPVKEHFQTSKNKCCKIKPKVNTSINTIHGNYIPQKLNSMDKINSNNSSLCKIKKEKEKCKKKKIVKCKKYKKPENCNTGTDNTTSQCEDPIQVTCKSSSITPVPKNPCKEQNCNNCTCPNYPDMSKYILKSKIMTTNTTNTTNTNITPSVDLSKCIIK